MLEIKIWFAVRTLSGLRADTCPPSLVRGRESETQKELQCILLQGHTSCSLASHPFSVIPPDQRRKSCRRQMLNTGAGAPTYGFWGHRSQLLTAPTPRLPSLALGLEGLFVSLLRKRQLRSFSPSCVAPEITLLSQPDSLCSECGQIDRMLKDVPEKVTDNTPFFD